MTIHEFCSLTGLPPRRVRFYVAQGVFPAPKGYGRWAEYGPLHLTIAREMAKVRHLHGTLSDLAERRALTGSLLPPELARNGPL